MKYYQWADMAETDSDAEQWSVDFPVWVNERWNLLSGQLVTNWEPRITARYSAFGRPVDFPIVMGEWTVHSQRIRELLEREVPGAVQYLPFQLQSSVGNERMEDYHVANYLIFLDCLDRQRTELDGDWCPINELGDFPVSRPVLSRALIREHRLFRVKGDSGTVVVRADMKAVLENEGITGCLFEPIEVSE